MSRLLMMIVLLGAFVVSVCAEEPKAAEKAAQQYQDYKRVIQNTAGMVADGRATALAAKHGLSVLNLTWEDTGRFKNSSVGDNISDMTIQVQQMDPRTEKFSLTCMPVIRYDNFNDKSADISPENFFLLVGNEKGGDLKKVSLKKFLEDPRSYLSVPGSWKGEKKSLLAARDTHVLVSAQACFLPIPKAGIAEFNPVLFNYQSTVGNPAVLTILATREGTSVTVIDNVRDAFQAGATWGQRLFFNKAGQRCSFNGKRMSDFLADNPSGDDSPAPEASGQQGLNMVLLIQVPLKHKELAAPSIVFSAGEAGCEKCKDSNSDVEAAVIGHGRVEGPFTEIADLPIERDERFPVRVTVQFYKATSNGAVSGQDMQEVADQIKKVYADADYTGSLVTAGATGRPTEHDGPKVEPADWWEKFWKRHEANTGQTEAQAMEMLHKLRGVEWKPRNEFELAGAVKALK